MSEQKPVSQRVNERIGRMKLNSEQEHEMRKQHSEFSPSLPNRQENLICDINVSFLSWSDQIFRDSKWDDSNWMIQSI